jgi:hypothetical protein
MPKNAIKDGIFAVKPFASFVQKISRARGETPQKIPVCLCLIAGIV